jgi:hypothetical protein
MTAATGSTDRQLWALRGDDEAKPDVMFVKVQQVSVTFAPFPAIEILPEASHRLTDIVSR